MPYGKLQTEDPWDEDLITAIWTKVTIGEGGYVVLFNFTLGLNFISLWLREGVVMYDNEFKTRGNEI